MHNLDDLLIGITAENLHSEIAVSPVYRLTERDIDVLHEVLAAQLNDDGAPTGIWASPREIWGSFKSFRYLTLVKLTKRGLIERRKSANMARGSCRYRITDLGISKLQADHSVAE